MREIKFRAWDKLSNGGIMLAWDQISKWDCTMADLFIDGQYHIMQFSGLKDKNGKDVYDGDILKVTNKAALNGDKVVVWDSITMSYVLVWSELFNKWKNTSGGTTYLKVSSGIKCEVIGNIYENPELLADQ